MELIEKQAAIESLNRIPRIKGIGMELLIAVPDVEKMIAGLPTVPAVPLDKLCEWLGERYEPPYSLIEIDKLKWPIDFRQQKEMWMVALTKWMEGLDAAD